MKRILALIFLSATLAKANDEIIIELPGGVPLEMVWIEPDSFIMGSPEVGVTPREVTISQGFYLGKYEITQEQWQAVMGTAPWSSARNSFQGPRLPAGISWHDAQAFAQRLNDHFGEDAYRLPTEAEWEYACRAGTTTRWSFGDDESRLASYAWYKANARDAGRDHFHPVGAKLPNPWGLFDMYGNAWEWVYDWYDYNAHDGTPQTDPTGPVSGHYRIQKGGAYYIDAQHTVGAYHSYAPPDSPGFQRSGARLLKGAPLNVVILERIPFPQNSSGPFFPVHEDNIWIMASHSYGYGPPGVDTTAYVLESQIIERKQYWLGFLGWWPFRVDENGNIWIRPDSAFSENTRHFLQAIDDNPELRESQYYQQSSVFKDLDPDQKDLLLYDFDGGVFDPDSPTLEMDLQVHGLYFRGLNWVVWKTGEPARDQRSFQISNWGTEWSTTQTFQRGLGIVSITWRDAHTTSQTDIELLWARIDGKEYGLHPGPGYPGYQEILTAVTSPELTSAHPTTSGLSPNFPNPFNASTQIAYHLATPGPVRLTIYNILGQPVRTLVDQFQAAGFYQVRWNARDQRGTALATGVYLVRLHYPSGEQTRRLLLLK